MNIKKLLESKTDILLVTLPPWDVETPNIGLGYLAEYLERKGLKVKVFDFNTEFFNKFKYKYGYLWKMHNQRYWFNEEKFKKLFELMKDEVENCVNKIIKSEIKIVAFSVANPKERITIEVIKKIKKIKPDIRVILGGPVCNYEGSRFLFTDKIPKLIDYYVIGEGEETLYRIVKTIKNKGGNQKLKGVVFYNNGKYSKLLLREPIDYEKIDIFPTYSQFDLKKYTNPKMITVQWSRGCIGNCSFCPNRDIWKGYRTRSPRSIFNEIKYHVEKKNIRDFSVCDSTINGNLKNLESVCNLIIESGLKIRWSGLAIPKSMNYKLLEKMKKSGCYRLEYGVESGSEHVLGLMEKLHHSKEAEKIIKMTHNAEIMTIIFIIVGFPGETKKDFGETLNFIKRNKNYIDLVRSVNGPYLMDGTKLKENAEEYGIIIKDNDETGYEWYTINGNNPEERNKKVKKVISLLDKLNIKHELDTSFETEKKNAEIKIKDFKNSNKTKEERVNLITNGNKKVKYMLNKLSKIKNVFRKRINNNIKDIKEIQRKLIPTPKYVTIDLTNSCNLNCIGCWTYSPLLKDKEASKEWKSEVIPFDKLKKLIDDLYDLGTKHIRLTGGGEPFLYPRIMDVIKLVKEKGMNCDITTNFTLLDKEKIKKLFELNVDELVVSLWAGDADTYVKTHPNQTIETFERIKENLEFIAQYKEKLAKGPKVIMANVISNINYDKIEEMAKFATQVSVDELYFTLIDPIKDKTDSLLLKNNERGILLKKLKRGIKIIGTYNRKSRIHKIGIDNINRFIAKVKSEKADDGKYDLGVINKPCYIGYIFARILANGDIVPCCRAVMYPMGNINKRSFKDIWFSEEYDKFRERALHESKLNPYFKKIGCYMTCDNIVHNREVGSSMKISKKIKIPEGNTKEKYDAILVICPPWGIFSPPLGPNYISSFLDSKGYKSKILDLNIILYKKNKNMQKYWQYDFKDYWLDESSLMFLYDKFSEEIEKFISQIINTKCKLIGFSAYQNNIQMILKIASKIKKIDPDIKIVVGGPSCSIERERKIFYKPFIDFIVVGEGEETLRDLLNHIKRKGNFSTLPNIPGLINTATNKNLKFSKRRPLDVKEMTNYKNNIKIVKEYGNTPMVSILMSRGCIGNCTFCNDKNLMEKYRVRPAEQVINEIKYYINNGITFLSFNDLLINGNIKELEKLCDFIIKDNLQVSWTANAIASKNLTFNMLKKIKKSGCISLIFGIESGSNRILRDMRKPIKIGNVEKILSNCKKLGIETWVNFIVGYPTETEEDFHKTLRFIEKNNKNIDKILNANVCSALHNSDIMLNTEKYNIKIPDNELTSEMEWYTRDGKNTWKVREKRLKILLKKARGFGIPIEQTNLKVLDYYRKKGII